MSSNEKTKDAPTDVISVEQPIVKIVASDVLGKSVICCDRFGDKKIKWPSSTGKKVTIKIDKSDGCLIDYLKECYPSISKTDLITRILSKALFTELVKIPQVDARIWIAEKADKKVEYPSMGIPWSFLVVAEQAKELVKAMRANCIPDVIFEYFENSEEYKALVEFDGKGDK